MPGFGVSFFLNRDATGGHTFLRVDTDGSLRTMFVLDYEQTPSFKISVTAVNDLNQSLTRSFSVAVRDLYEPVVNSPPTGREDRSLP